MYNNEYNYSFTPLTHTYKMDNLIVIAVITTMAALFILMTGVSIILSIENTDKQVTHRV